MSNEFISFSANSAKFISWGNRIPVGVEKLLGKLEVLIGGGLVGVAVLLAVGNFHPSIVG